MPATAYKVVNCAVHIPIGFPDAVMHGLNDYVECCESIYWHGRRQLRRWNWKVARHDERTDVYVKLHKAYHNEASTVHLTFQAYDT
jgi:hypothetical protein